MNQNTEYEKFTQEIYQELINTEGITIDVKHNLKLKGKSGQEHQIDVFWEYEIAGVKHKFAIECKNYNKTVPVGKVRDFHSVLSDLNNVNGVIVTKVGYQTGAKKYAEYYGINLMELRTPNEEDGIIGEIQINMNINKCRRLFLVDRNWAEENNINLSLYRSRLNSLLPRNEWMNDDYLTFGTRDGKIIDKNGKKIITIDELEMNLLQKAEPIHDFEDAYLETFELGLIKIKAVKYIYIEKKEIKEFAIDARSFIEVILKDALSGEIKFFDKNGYIEKP